MPKRFTEEQLAQWKKQILTWAKTKHVFLYFDNDEKGYAVKDALALKQMIF